MNSESSAIYTNKANPKRREMSKVKAVDNNRFSFRKNGLKMGLMAGLGMSLYLVLINSAVPEFAPGLRLLKYTILGVFVVFGLKQYQSHVQSNKIFKNGIGYGAWISIVATATLIIFNLVASAIIGEPAFNKFGMDEYAIIGNDGISTLAVSGIFLFETFVFGMLITFITLQYLKSTFKPNEGILEDSGNVPTGYNQK